MNKRNLIIACMAGGLFFFPLYTYVPILSTYAGSLGASLSMIGLIGGAYGFSQMVVRLPMGIWSDKVGRRKPFVLGAVCMGLLSSLLVVLVQSPVSLFICRILAGFAAAGWVQMSVLFAENFAPDDTPRAMGILNACNNTGQMASTLLCGVVASAWGELSTFWLGVISAALVLIPVTLLHERVEKREPLKLRALLSVAAEKPVLVATILATLAQFITFATIYGFNPIVARNLGASSLELSILTAINTLPGIGGAILCGRIAKRFGDKYPLFVGMAVTALLCFVTPYAPGVWALYGIQATSGFFRGLTFALLMGLVIRKVEQKRRATAMGFFQAVYGLGMFAGPAVVGLLSDLGGLPFGFAATGILGALTAVGILLLNFKDMA